MVKNDLLIIRYNQVLWNSHSKYKHKKQSNATIDAYFRLLESYKANKEIKGYNWNFLSIFKNLLPLCFGTKYKVDKTKELINVFLFTKSGFPNQYKILLIEFLLGVPQIKKLDLINILPLIKRIGTSSAKKKSDYFDQRKIYDIGLRVAQKLGSDLTFWYNKIGDSICKAAKNRLNDETRLVPLSLYREAIPFYKKAGNEKRVKQVEETYFNLKKELKLKRFILPLEDKDAEAINTYLNTLCDNLLKQKPKEIFDYLTVGKNIFPNSKSLEQSAMDERNSFVDMAMVYKFDINNNVARDSGNEKDKAKASVYQNYHHYLNFFLLPFLHKLFVRGINTDIINYKELVTYFLENTWLGQDITEYSPDREMKRYKWIGLIAPSLLEYFMQTKSALKSTNSFTNYILCIDSLTLKFEGALRSFASVINISTTTLGKNDVLREKYIEELLGDEKMQKYFDENDRLFFNFLFVAKDGLNLRNNIAHSFFKFENYTFQHMHLLICAFLRLGKYKLTKSTS